MRVLVTGHNGYIGSVMTRVLLDAGHTVVGLDTDYFADCELFQPESEVESIHKDIRDVEPGDLKGFDAVVHLAALSNDPLGDLDPDLTYDINHRSSVELARMARDAGVSRFLYSSSCSMYGAGSGGFLDEDAPFNPLTPYAVSKVRTEEDLEKLADRGFSPVYMRNATAYGVSSRLRADIVLNNLVCWAYATGEVRIISDGMAWRPIVHIADIAGAFAAALVAARDAVHNQAFNVGVNGENYRVRQLAEIVEETVPGCRVTYSGEGAADQRSYRVDFTKLARSLPGFRPRWNARLGAEELHSEFKRVGLRQEDFQGRRYVRLNQLKHLLSTGRIGADLRWAV